MFLENHDRFILMAKMHLVKIFSKNNDSGEFID